MVSVTCAGETCWCGEAAVKKVGEEIAFDDPMPNRHNLTAYVCAAHYSQLMGPAGARQVGLNAIAMETRRAETSSGSVEDDSAAIAQRKSA